MLPEKEAFLGTEMLPAFFGTEILPEREETEPLQEKDGKLLSVKFYLGTMYYDVAKLLGSLFPKPFLSSCVDTTSSLL